MTKSCLIGVADRLFNLTMANLIFCWLAVFGCYRAEVAPSSLEPPQTKFEFALSDPAIQESSGLAHSIAARKLWWTHNDSGDTARFFAFTDEGKVAGEFALKGATATDWEDMAAARVSNKNYLYFGDIGDNRKQRAFVVVYRVEEPTLETPKAELNRFDRFELEYPDGPRDCETLLVFPNGAIELVSKESSGASRVYRIDSPKLKGRNKMKFVGVAEFEKGPGPASLATGGAVSLDGKRVVVRTYTSARIWSVPEGGRWMDGTPTVIPVTGEFQGEAITFDPGGNSLWTTSEGSPCRVSRTAIR